MTDVPEAKNQGPSTLPKSKIIERLLKRFFAKNRGALIRPVANEEIVVTLLYENDYANSI